MKVKPTIKAYETEDLVVEWQPSLCIHSEKCWRGLPQVFRPNDKPWVYLEGAKDAVIKKQVDTCPSGALSGYWKNQKDEATTNTDSAQVEVTKNGPLMVRGRIDIKHADGKSEMKEKVTAFCRCGASGNKPFCDGSHNQIGFEG